MKEPEIYEKLKQLRKERGLTLNNLAEKIGSDYQQISRIERGKSRLTIDVLMKLAEALDTPIHDIVEGSGEDKKVALAEPASADTPSAHEMLANILEKIEHVESELKVKLRSQTKAALASQIYLEIHQLHPINKDPVATQKFIDYSMAIVKAVCADTK